MKNLKNWILSLVACAFLFAPGATWAMDAAEMDLYRALKRYIAEYGANSLSKSDIAALKKAAMKNSTEAVRLGLWNYQQKRYDDTFDAFSEAADRGNQDGVLLQGICYLTQTGTKDKAKGPDRIKKAADKGHPVAQYLMGSLYRDGFGVSKKSSESKKWFNRAAKQGMKADALTDSAKFASVLTAWRGATPVATKPTTAPDSGTSTRSPPASSGSSAPPTLKPEGDPVMNKVWYKDGSKMPDPAGLSLTTMQNAWDRLRKVTKIDAWLIYDDKDELNAYMTKNDKGEIMVVVYRGLMKIFRTEDELAGVLGHESAHALRGHLEKGRTQQIGVSVAASVLSSLLGSSIADVAIGAGAALATSGYSREAEVEADDYGTEYAAKAGYTPFALYNAVKRMADSGAVTPPSGFNSHPPTERRMQRLSDQAAKWQKKPGEEGKKQ